MVPGIERYAQCMPLETRRRLVPAGRRGVGERGAASSRRGKARRRLIRELEDEATPHLPAGERGAISSPHGKTRRHLVPKLEDEETPRLLAGERGIASSPRGKTR
ncbi:hypothetical protein B296_00009131 [Ensete ventricosum]|uniref:Uncharacterized protein n=1 Tax=Ensete ventricosum TaxID=4639 RepID=A0A427A4P4_ENSVE|nr:hypothetical protein B296_00009131 [Ensete ventricosum]